MARHVFDVTGAGDTVIAVLAASIAAGEELPNAVALANTAASAKTVQASVVAVFPDGREFVVQERTLTIPGGVSGSEIYQPPGKCWVRMGWMKVRLKSGASERMS